MFKNSNYFFWSFLRLILPTRLILLLLLLLLLLEVEVRRLEEVLVLVGYPR